MKITGIDIGEYRQFKNIKFDFTYPIGHPKEGQPLEKICFIGQSGTGKTTLLNIIWDFFQVVSSSFQRMGNKRVPEEDEYYKTFLNIDINFVFNKNKNALSKSDFKKTNEWVDIDEKSFYAAVGFNWLYSQNIYNDLKDIIRKEKLCLYIDEAAVSTSKNLLEERDLNNKNLISLKGQTNSYPDTEIDKPILGLNEYSSEVLWSSIVSEIDQYDDELKQLAASLVSSNSFSESRLVTQIREWQKEHSNPRAELAKNCLDRILNLFYLQIDTDGTESRLVLKNEEGKQIPGKHLSTGTKQLITTSIPIYKTNVSEGVILFDEPERSLFPNIQRELIKHYTSLASKAQFFFATHSPIIASAFEPCERFILYFNENGEVEFRNGIAPIGDDPNDVLRQDFGLNELMLDEGLEAYQEYRRLGLLIRQETDGKKKNELIAERIELGNRYNF